MARCCAIRKALAGRSGVKCDETVIREGNMTDVRQEGHKPRGCTVKKLQGLLLPSMLVTGAEFAFEQVACVCDRDMVALARIPQPIPRLSDFAKDDHPQDGECLIPDLIGAFEVLDRRRFF